MITSYATDFARIRNNNIYVYCDDQLLDDHNRVALCISSGELSTVLRGMPSNHYVRFNIAPIIANWLENKQSEAFSMTIQNGNPKDTPTELTYYTNTANGIDITLTQPDDPNNQTVKVFYTDGFLIPFQNLNSANSKFYASKRRNFIKYSNLPLQITLRNTETEPTFYVNGRPYKHNQPTLAGKPKHKHHLMNLLIPEPEDVLYGEDTPYALNVYKSTPTDAINITFQPAPKTNGTLIYLRWINSQGGWEYQLLQPITNIITETKDTQTYDCEQFTNNDENTYTPPQILTRTLSQSLEVCAPQLSATDYKVCQELATSHTVQIYANPLFTQELFGDTNNWLPVSVQDCQLTSLTSNVKQDLILTLKLFQIKL